MTKELDELLSDETMSKFMKAENKKRIAKQIEQMILTEVRDIIECHGNLENVIAKEFKRWIKENKVMLEKEIKAKAMNTISKMKTSLEIWS